MGKFDHNHLESHVGLKTQGCPNLLTSAATPRKAVSRHQGLGKTHSKGGVCIVLVLSCVLSQAVSYGGRLSRTKCCTMEGGKEGRGGTQMKQSGRNICEPSVMHPDSYWVSSELLKSWCLPPGRLTSSAGQQPVVSAFRLCHLATVFSRGLQCIDILNSALR